MMDEKRSGSELFRELLRVFPGAFVEDYYTNGRWDVENLQIDIEIMERHRQEAGAPEPPHLEEIPEPVLPDALRPPWQMTSSKTPAPPRTQPPASARRSEPSPRGTDRPQQHALLSKGMKRKSEKDIDDDQPKQMRTSRTPQPSSRGAVYDDFKTSGVNSAYTRPQSKIVARPSTASGTRPSSSTSSSNFRHAARPSQNPSSSFTRSRESSRGDTRAIAHNSLEMPTSRSSREGTNGKPAKGKSGEEIKPGDLISLLLS